MRHTEFLLTEEGIDYAGIDPLPLESLPEGRLLQALVTQSLDEAGLSGLFGGRPPSGKHSFSKRYPRHVVVAAREWLLDESREPFSSSWCFELLGLDEQLASIREHLRKEEE